MDHEASDARVVEVEGATEKSAAGRAESVTSPAAAETARGSGVAGVAQAAGAEGTALEAAGPGAAPLRAASEADLDAIWAIETAVFGAEAWSRDVMREELTADHRRYLVLEGPHGDVLGYGGLLAVGADGDIQTIALDPSARGAGQGRRMMNALLDEAAARRVRQVFLEVRADNPAALGLYTSLGFEQIGVRPRYYQPDDVDAIVMRLHTKDRR